MRITSYFFILILLFFSCSQNNDGAVIRFNNDNKSFIVGAGKEKEIRFEFKNIGSEPLTIKTASSECGCTKINYPKSEILPNEEGVIAVIFDSKGFPKGAIVKYVAVETNSKPIIQILTLTGVIK